MFPGIHRTVLYSLVDQFVNVGIVHAPEVRVEEALGALETTIIKVNTPENDDTVFIIASVFPYSWLKALKKTPEL